MTCDHKGYKQVIGDEPYQLDEVEFYCAKCNSAYAPITEEQPNPEESA